MQQEVKLRATLAERGIEVVDERDLVSLLGDDRWSHMRTYDTTLDERLGFVPSHVGMKLIF